MSRCSHRSNWTLVLLLAVGGCDFITAPAFPSLAEPFTPPAVYATWWDMTESCASRSALFENIEWFVIPGSRSFVVGGEEVGGYWFPNRNAIVIASGAVLEGSLVRHEMLHALLRKGGHSRAEFLGRCAGTVACEGNCLRDAGAPPAVPASILRVTPNSLHLVVSVEPQMPSASVLDGYFSVTVRVRNAATNAVFVDLPPAGDAGPPVSFSYRLFGPRGGVFYSNRAWDTSVRMFRAGETKLMVYDFFAGGEIREGGLPLGVYSLEAAYGDHWSPRIAVTLDP